MNHWLNVLFIYSILLIFPHCHAETLVNGELEKTGDAQKIKKFNFALNTAGAVILDKSPANAKGYSNLLSNDEDDYAISLCSEEKWVVIGLSEDVSVTEVVVANYEKYSSKLKEFNISTSTVFPTNHWKGLGTFQAKPILGEQSFSIVETHGHTRYLKVHFLTHYDNDQVCTVSQIKVHGNTFVASLTKEVELSDNLMKEIRTHLNIHDIFHESNVASENEFNPTLDTVLNASDINLEEIQLTAELIGIENADVLVETNVSENVEYSELQNINIVTNLELSPELDVSVNQIATKLGEETVVTVVDLSEYVETSNEVFDNDRDIKFETNTELNNSSCLSIDDETNIKSDGLGAAKAFEHSVRDKAIGDQLDDGTITHDTDNNIIIHDDKNATTTNHSDVATTIISSIVRNILTLGGNSNAQINSHEDEHNISSTHAISNDSHVFNLSSSADFHVSEHSQQSGDFATSEEFVDTSETSHLSENANIIDNLNVSSSECHETAEFNKSIDLCNRTSLTNAEDSLPINHDLMAINSSGIEHNNASTSDISLSTANHSSISHTEASQIKLHSNVSTSASIKKSISSNFTHSNSSNSFNLSYCHELLKFEEFHAKILAKLQASDPDSSQWHSNSQDNVIKQLVVRIRSVEINYAITEIYLSHISECYRALLLEISPSIASSNLSNHTENISKYRSNLSENDTIYNLYSNSTCVTTLSFLIPKLTEILTCFGLYDREFVRYIEVRFLDFRSLFIYVTFHVRISV